MLFFLTGVGIRAGYSFAQTLRQNGLAMLAGAAITLAVNLVSLVVGYKLLKIPFTSLMGLGAGIQTQPARLAYATCEANSDAPNVTGISGGDDRQDYLGATADVTAKYQLYLTQ